MAVEFYLKFRRQRIFHGSFDRVRTVPLLVLMEAHLSTSFGSSGQALVDRINGVLYKFTPCCAVSGVYFAVALLIDRISVSNGDRANR